jgi:hypothetical protein
MSLFVTIYDVFVVVDLKSSISVTSRIITIRTHESTQFY